MIQAVLSFNFPATTFLGGLPDAAREAIAYGASRCFYRRGELVVGAEDTTSELFFLISGIARAGAVTSNGRELAFRDLHAGDCFGEVAALDGGPRTANVVAYTDIEVAAISQAQMRELIIAHPDFAFALLALLARKVRSESKRMTDYSELSGPQRVCQELLSRGRQSSSGEDFAKIVNPPNQAEFAALIFSTRETVSREVNRLKSIGLVEWGRGEIKIHSVSGLNREFRKMQGE